jgi:hypothetical protein
MYQLEKEEGSEFGASIVHGGLSKTSLTAQQLVNLNFYLFEKLSFCFCSISMINKRVYVVHNR